MQNLLYYGDNLGILRDEIDDESVDLVYLDPPFNSNATYNVLLSHPTVRTRQHKLRRSMTRGIGVRRRRKPIMRS